MESSELETYNELQKPIQYLVDCITSNKLLLLPTDSYSFENNLLDANIIRIVNDNYEIIDFEIISFYVLNFYKKKFKFESNEDFRKNIEFLNKIESDFCSKNYVHNFSILKEHLWKLIVIEANNKHNCDFSEYLNTFEKEKESDEIFHFIETYSASLPNLNIAVKIVYENSLILLDFAKSDAAYNLPLGNILGGLKQKCKNDSSFGIELFNYCHSIHDMNENILSSVVTGLFEEKRSLFFEEHLKLKLQKNDGVKAILWGLSNVSNLTESDCNLFIHLVDQFESNKDFNLPILALLISILKSSNSQFHNFCFEKITNSVYDENNVAYILTNVARVKNHIEEKTHLLVSLIKQDFFSVEKHLRGIEYFFRHFKDIGAFKKVLIAIAEKVPFKPIAQGFHSFLSSSNKEDLDKLLIELLTDNIANKRFIGVNFFDELSSHSPYKFVYDILLLEPILQYKLLVALSQGFKEPKYHIPALLQLLDSKSEFIKEAFICKLEEISEDYKGHIIDILENNLDTEKHKKVICRIKNYISDFYSMNVDIKKSIKELNPYFTHYKYINLYNKLFNKRMSQTINKDLEKNSLIGILGIDTVQLAKGGGWKISTRKEISKLGIVGTNFSLPRSYFINPNEYEVLKGIEMKMDWDEADFQEIQKFL